MSPLSISFRYFSKKLRGQTLKPGGKGGLLVANPLEVLETFGVALNEFAVTFSERLEKLERSTEKMEEQIQELSRGSKGQ